MGVCLETDFSFLTLQDLFIPMMICLLSLLGLLKGEGSVRNELLFSWPLGRRIRVSKMLSFSVCVGI